MYYKVRDFKVRTNIGNFKGTLFKLKYHHKFKIEYKQISIVVDNKEYISDYPILKLAQSVIDSSTINYSMGDITLDKCIKEAFPSFKTEYYIYNMKNTSCNFELPFQTSIQSIVERMNNDLCKNIVKN